MQSLRSAACWIARTAAAISIAFLTAAAVLAVDAAPAQPSAGPGYVKSYMLTVLAVALGLIVVARSANRTTEVKYFDDD